MPPFLAVREACPNSAGVTAASEAGFRIAAAKVFRERWVLPRVDLDNRVRTGPADTSDTVLPYPIEWRPSVATSITADRRRCRDLPTPSSDAPNKGGWLLAAVPAVRASEWRLKFEWVVSRPVLSWRQTEAFPMAKPAKEGRVEQDSDASSTFPPAVEASSRAPLSPEA